MTNERFYPKGYLGSEQSILLIAKTRDQKRWQTQTLLDGEREIWEGLGSVYNAEFITDHLKVLVKDPRRSHDASMINRLCDYSDALVELRKSLRAGDITAYFCDDAGKMRFIIKDGWGGDEAPDILLRGIVDLVDGWRRTLLFKRDDVIRLASSLPSAWQAKDPSPQATRSVQRKLVEKRKLFQDWRESLDGRIPTLSEDIATMKVLGISRDDARQLRKQHLSLPRGKPKTKNENRRT
jgi:hypothetical protein